MVEESKGENKDSETQTRADVLADAKPVTGDRHYIASHKDGESQWTTEPFIPPGEDKGKRGKKEPKIKYVFRPFGRADPLRGIPFYEQAVVDGRLCFIIVDENGRIDTALQIVVMDENRPTIILPQRNLPYADYVIKKDWLDNSAECLSEELWAKARQLILAYTDFLEPAADTAKSLSLVKLSYVADIVYTAVCYLFLLGSPDSGKTHVAHILSWLCNRPLYSESLPAADIYEFLTNTGLVIIEDEAQGLEKDWDKMKIYKGGYRAGSKAPRILIDKNRGERRQVFYDIYGVKIFAAENQIKNDAFMQRCLIIPMVKGRPAKDEYDPADAALIEEIRGRLLVFRILVAAGKVEIPEYRCDEPWFEGRFKQLYKALLAVASPLDRESIIEGARRRFEEQKMELRENIDAKTVMAYLRAVNAVSGNFNVSAEDVLEQLKDEVTDVAVDKRPTIRSTGSRLTKLGFKRVRAPHRVGEKRTHLRSADASVLTKLVRKYDLGDAVKEEKLDAILAAAGVIIPTAGSGGSIGSGAEISPGQAKIDVDYGKPERGPSGSSGPISPVPTLPDVKYIRQEVKQDTFTAEPSTPALDNRREAALQILRACKDGWSFQDAVAAVMAVYPDRDEATHFMNRLVGDGFFAQDSDGRWRLTK